MNKIIQKNFNLILVIFVLMNPIIDLVTGICLHVFDFNITFGNIIRILFLIFIMYSTIFIYKKKIPIIYYLIVGIYFVLYFFNCFILKNNIGLFTEIQGLIRTFYFPIILISLYVLKDKLNISDKILTITFTTYLLFIFIPIIFNIGYDSYEITKVGTLGFFNSANEISGIISILTPISIIMFQNKSKYLLKILLMIIYLIVIFTMGTKTPILSFLITIFMIMIWLYIKCILNKKYKLLIILSVVVLLGATSLSIIVPKTNFYKNIEIHLDYLGVDNVIDVIKDEELIDHFVFSQRLTFWNNREDDFGDVNVYQKLTGIGYLENGNLSKLVEMDYIDIYYSHGIIGFIIFFGAYLYVLVNIFKEKIKLNFKRYMYITSFVLILILSLLTGHIIVSPAVSFIAIIIILNLYKKEDEKGA